MLIETSKDPPHEIRKRVRVKLAGRHESEPAANMPESRIGGQEPHVNSHAEVRALSHFHRADSALVVLFRHFLKAGTTADARNANRALRG